jgi:hypothetical protein
MLKVFMLSVAFFIVILSFLMLSVVMLSVIILGVAAPFLAEECLSFSAFTAPFLTILSPFYAEQREPGSPL